MAGSPSTIIVQLFNDWEIELLILLSFALQLFLFFFGGLRRRNNHMLVQLPLWLAYLSADSIAIYALGYLSRHSPSTTYNGYAVSNQTQLLKLLWAPFLLVHLGGQDTLTAFSIEDNELWLRHMLNFLVQVSLVLYAVCMSMSIYDRPAVPAIFVFFTGIIKYGERIWALKRGSQKSLKSSGRIQVAQSQVNQQGGTEQTYRTFVKQAVECEEGVRYLFAGQTFFLMIGGKAQSPFDNVYFQDSSEPSFKQLEVELSIMYGLLFTKSRIIHTILGTILRCFSLTSMMVAFLLFIVMGTAKQQTYNFAIVDTTITYILFMGAVFLEGCSVFILMTSPPTWATLGARGYSWPARVAWSMFMKMHPKTRPWWSNSMGRYSVVSSCMVDRKSGMFLTAVTKMAGFVGANEFWNRMRYVKFVEVPTWIEQLMDKTINDVRWNTTHLNLGASVSTQFEILVSKFPFEIALLALHVWTERLIKRAQTSRTSKEMQKLMDQCKGMSEYMVHLLVVNPAMLPVTSGVDELVAGFKKNINQVMSDEKFCEASIYDLLDDNSRRLWGIRRLNSEVAESMSLPEQQGGLHTAFESLMQVWARMLLYAAGKCRPEEHARRLAMGGELLTFVWLAMLHKRLGDQGSFGLRLMPLGDGQHDPGASTMETIPLLVINQTKGEIYHMDDNTWCPICNSLPLSLLSGLVV